MLSHPSVDDLIQAPPDLHQLDDPTSHTHPHTQLYSHSNLKMAGHAPHNPKGASASPLYAPMASIANALAVVHFDPALIKWNSTASLPPNLILEGL